MRDFVSEIVLMQTKMSWFYYNCDGIDDRGWGCVHRSYQNAMSLLKHKVRMKDLVAKFGDKKWIEPAKLRSCLPEGFKSELILWTKTSDCTQKMTCTKPKDYNCIIPSHSEVQLYDALYALARTFVFVMDNGVYSYCVFYSNGWRMLDPHTDRPEKVPGKIDNMHQWLAQNGLWMVMAISLDVSKVEKPMGKHVSFGPSASIPSSSSGSSLSSSGSSFDADDHVTDGSNTTGE